MTQTVLDAQNVLNACKRYREARESRMSELREEMITKLVGTRTWFGLGKPRTREDAIEQLKGDPWNDYNMVYLCGGFEYRVVLEAESTAKLAHVCNKDVQLGGDACRALEQYF